MEGEPYVQPTDGLADALASNATLLNEVYAFKGTASGTSQQSETCKQLVQLLSEVWRSIPEQVRCTHHKNMQPTGPCCAVLQQCSLH